MTGIAMTLDELRDLARAKLLGAGLAAPHAEAVAETMVAGERDGCSSHGIYRLLVAVSSINKGVVVPDAEPILSEPARALVRVDGGGGFAQLAFQTGKPLLIEK
ncbi:Ldh family oxidoreductase, partial [uncultured Sphingomonas sp.]